MTGRTRFTWKLLSVAVISAALTGCGDVTGEKPKIASHDPTPAPTKAPAPATASPAPADSGWNTVADAAFSTATRATTASAATATPPSAPAGPPALTAADPAFAEASTPWLRQAAKTSVHWRQWSADALAEARNRNVPVLIVIGASWSHDARVMDTAVYSDPEISDVINKNFVPIRVDAEERPDIWSRYRLAFEVLNKKAASPPLAVFAAADGRPFDIVEAQAPRATGDSAGMLELLNQAATLFTSQPAEIAKQADSIEGVLSRLMVEPRVQDTPDAAALVAAWDKEMIAAAKGDQADALRAGRVAGALLASGSGASKDAASELLLSRFRSGQRDHVLGGYFFRVPGSGAVQFGKLLPVQSELLAANAAAFAATNKTLHKEAAAEILRFCRDWLEAPEGGFFSGQAPDITGDDSGSYFTWSREEIAQIAGDEKQATVFSTYLNAGSGEKTNLHVTGKLQQAADAAGVSYEEANKALNAVRLKLAEARMGAEQTPIVDKSLLASWNGDMICAYLDAAKALGDDKAKEFALKSADRIVETMISEKEGVAHVLYKGRATGFGYLDDNVKVAAALARCYEATSQKEYLESAVSLMEYVEARFLDKDSGLYTDVIALPADQGLLKLKRLPLDDDISRSANAVAALLWTRLASAASKPDYTERAKRLINAAAQRRTFNTEAQATWAQAAGEMK